jgi:carbamoyltransferase
MVLNTSFNVKGQAIVNTPIEAIETFLSTGIQALCLEDVLVSKR